MSSGDQTNLFGEGTVADAEGLVRDVEMTLGESPLARPARVGFLAGMLATWTLGPGTKAKEVELQVLRDVARRAISEAEALITAARADR